MIILIPVSQFRITYDVGTGRPFSEFERLILRAIQEGASELAELQRIFEVHPRLLIEGLVTLTHAGWLAVGGAGHGGFVLTSGGNEAAGSDNPPSTTEVSSRQALIIMERISGALISNDEVRFVSKREMAGVWDQSIRLRLQIPDNRLDEGQVQHLLPRRQGEWVRWIGPIDMLSKNAHWLPVNVDVDENTVVGLPDAWVPRLRSIIITEAQRAQGSLDTEGQVQTWTIRGPRRSRVAAVEANTDVTRVPPLGSTTRISLEDFCFTAAEHETLLSSALSEARHTLLIGSAFAGINKLEHLRASMAEALQRGVNLDVLWGYAGDGHENPQALIDWLRKFAFDAKRYGRGTLRFNRARSASHAKCLIWDNGPVVSATIGSYNWLSAKPAPGSQSPVTDMTVRITEPALVAAVCRCAAGLWSGLESETLSSAADRWRSIAAQLDMNASSEAAKPANAKMHLVLDRAHEGLLADLMRSARNHLLVTSHQLGPAALVRLAAAEALHADPFEFLVLFGRSELDDVQGMRVSELVGKARGILRNVPGLHAKVAVSDATACVSSYNFLSGDPFGTSTNARELGLVIQGEQPSEWIWQRLRGQN